MSDVLKFRSLAELEEEAAAWVWRLDDEDVASQVRSEFEQWLRRDPRHRRAFEELGGVWRSLDELAEAKRDEKVATFVAEERRLHAKAAKPVRGRLRRWAPLAMAASLALIAGSFFWYQRGNESQTLATAVGQQRSMTLADGSVVQLNTNTILETRFTRGQRAVYLKKGEASFNVAKNPERPFLVHAGDIVVRAVGTEFNVRMRDARDVEVIVTEGKVEVTPQSGMPVNVVAGASPMVIAPARSELVAGQRFEAAAASPVARIPPTAVSNTLAWHEGAIVFDGEPLVQAIAELNRYTDTRLVVADASIYNLRVGGRFRTGDVDGFLQALTHAFPVTVRRTSDHLVYIHARAPAPSTHQ
ncbi:FecR domain-containing protein [Rhodanobacter sp. KK11]|jgi:transmembrane sensor|uniref:FecR family protein n=1 Tax=Rhodanobacter sp. KK11 TaxID=3083255 RepID=UPI00296762FA|nr:FecR domain-containing protein [Rhodanobacter sp. KK11]MDW2982835.1 FecR domain-containing protein [Rhodanobacter sp. KK11]